MHHIFVFHSPTKEHLDCFHVYGNAVANMGCRYLFEIVISFSSGKYPEVELLDLLVFINKLISSFS